MTLLIHIAGAGDLGVDILGLDHAARVQCRRACETQLEALLDRGDADTILSVLLDLDWQNQDEERRFNASPLGAVLDALHSADPPSPHLVHVLVLGSSGGRPGTSTDTTARLLCRALTNHAVAQGLRERFSLDVSAEAIVVPDLLEETSLPPVARAIETWRVHHPQERAVVSALAGATKVLFMAMGALARTGVSWGVARGDEARVHVTIPMRSRTDGASRWLLALGHVEQSTSPAVPEIPMDPTAEPVCALRSILERARRFPEDLTAADLGMITALSLVRADIGAGMPLRAWVERSFTELRDTELDSGSTVVLPAKLTQRYGEAGELGPLIAAAKDYLVSHGPKSGAVAWLAEQGPLNDMGKAGTHKVAVPAFPDAYKVLTGPLAQYEKALPPEVSRPWQRGIVYVAVCGTASNGALIPHRVLARRPPHEVRAALPGSGLDSVPDPVPSFLFIHSDHPDSRDLATRYGAAACEEATRPGWGRTSQMRTLAYERAEVAGTLVTQAMDAMGASAVVLADTGQKPAVLDVLGALQQWCLEHAVPFFLQSFVDGAGSQLHRLGLDHAAALSLLAAARSELNGLNLRGAARVLRAGDGDLDEMSDQCLELADQCATVVSSRDPDTVAVVILDVLRVICELWSEDLEWMDRARLVIMAGEIVSFPGNRVLMARNTNLGALGARPVCLPEIGASVPEGCRRATRKDLLELIVRVRHASVFAHGSDGPEGALCRVMSEAGVVVPRDFSYSDLLDHAIAEIEADAGHGGCPALGTSQWKAGFDLVRDEIDQLTGEM